MYKLFLVKSINSSTYLGNFDYLGGKRFFLYRKYETDSGHISNFSLDF